MELGQFGANRGARGEVTDDEGRRGIGVDTRRGDARGEVGAEAFPKAIGFKVTGTEFSPVHCVLCYDLPHFLPSCLLTTTCWTIMVQH